MRAWQMPMRYDTSAGNQRSWWNGAKFALNCRARTLSMEVACLENMCMAEKDEKLVSDYDRLNIR